MRQLIGPRAAEERPVPRRLRLLLLLAASCAPIASCGTDDGAKTGAAPEVVVAPVAKRDVEIYTEWVGTTTGYVNAQIFPKIQGYLLEQNYEDGNVVKEGQMLFRIDPRQFQAALQQALGQQARAQAALGKSELDVKRYTPLAAEGAVSQQELDDAIQARAANRAELDSAKAEVRNAGLNLDWTRVVSPITGVAAIATAQVGDLVGPTTLLTTISQLDPIKVNFPISEIEYLRFAPRIRERQEGGGTADEPGLELILADGTRYPERGRFNVAGLAVATTTGTIDVQGVFPNPQNLLRPGQFTKVRAATDRLAGALVIPQRAVRDLQGVSQVAVVGAEDKVSFKNVTLGAATGSDYVVTEGLEAGDRIVVEGLQKIRDGMVVRPTTAQAPEVGAAPPTAAAEARK
jgi:membrane fusion protein (multidrug efflux system)